MVGTEEDRMSSGRDLDLGRPDGPAGANSVVCFIHLQLHMYFTILYGYCEYTYIYIYIYVYIIIHICIYIHILHVSNMYIYIYIYIYYR